MGKTLWLILMGLILFSGETFGARNKTNRTVLITSETPLLSSNLLKDRTTYEIIGNHDLGGNEIVIPPHCNLVFKNGTISNGSIFFNNTYIENPSLKRMKVIGGTVSNEILNSNDFSCVDDTDLLLFLLGQNRSDIEINLEHRNYNVNSAKYIAKLSNDDFFVRYDKQHNIIINGNNCVILDKIPITLFEEHNIFGFLYFKNCTNVTIKDIQYKCSQEPVLAPRVAGITFIRTMEECCRFDIDVKVMNVGRGLYSGKFAYSGVSGKGLHDSKIIMHAYRAGYPIAIEKGGNLNITNYFNIAHRGTYLAGVSDTKVYVKGKEAYVTKVHLLLTDSADSLGCYFCDNIDATVIDTGTHEYSDLSQLAVCQIYSPSIRKAYEKRNRYNAKNLSFHVYTPHISDTSYEVFNITDLAQKGDRMEVTIDGDLKHVGGKSNRLFRVLRSSQGKVVFNKLSMKPNILLVSDLMPNGLDLVFIQCDDIQLFMDGQNRKTTGKLTFVNCKNLRKQKRGDSLSDYYPNVLNIN